jgi:hypothetical protein
MDDLDRLLQEHRNRLVAEVRDKLPPGEAFGLSVMLYRMPNTIVSHTFASEEVFIGNLEQLAASWKAAKR